MWRAVAAKKPGTVSHMLAANRTWCKSGNQDGKTILMFAAEVGDPETLEVLLRVGADPNRSDANGLTPLHIAAAAGDAPIAKDLLQAGARPALRYGKRKLSPIGLAAHFGHADVVKVLLDRGESPESVGPTGKVLLLEACAGGFVDTVRLLLDRGAKADAVDTDGWSALHVAAWNGHLAVARLLIARGADVNAQGKYGGHPLDAAARDDGDMVDLLRKHGGIFKQERLLKAYERFVFPEISFENVRLSTALDTLKEKSRAIDPDGKGILFMLVLPITLIHKDKVAANHDVIEEPEDDDWGGDDWGEDDDWGDEGDRDVQKDLVRVTVDPLVSFSGKNVKANAIILELSHQAGLSVKVEKYAITFTGHAGSASELYFLPVHSPVLAKRFRTDLQGFLKENSVKLAPPPPFGVTESISYDEQSGKIIARISRRTFARLERALQAHATRAYYLNALEYWRD